MGNKPAPAAQAPDRPGAPGSPFSASTLLRANTLADPKRVRALLQRGGGPAEHLRSTDHRGRTALHIASLRGFTATIPVLAEGQPVAFVDARDRAVHGGHGDTALELAVWARECAAVTALVKAGANVGSPNKQAQRGWTPLHVAAYLGDAAMCRLLIMHAAPLEAKSTVRSARIPACVCARVRAYACVPGCGPRGVRPQSHPTRATTTQGDTDDNEPLNRALK